jgi:O-methyltransferase involved in polyketide biosynthesis
LAQCRKRTFRSAEKLQPGEKRALGNITCRTKYLDDLILLFTHACSSLHGYFEQLAQAVASNSKEFQPGMKQIVLIGAGMDTRSSRLDVPEDVLWFELDRSSVLHVKHALLHKELQGRPNSRVIQASIVPLLHCHHAL